jgi:hypothetical protein
LTYDLEDDTIDLLDQVIRTQTGVNQTDINISRISVSTYATIPNKNTQGRPIQVWVNRQSGQPTLLQATTHLALKLNPKLTSGLRQIRATSTRLFTGV